MKRPWANVPLHALRLTTVPHVSVPTHPTCVGKKQTVDSLLFHSSGLSNSRGCQNRRAGKAVVNNVPLVANARGVGTETRGMVARRSPCGGTLARGRGTFPTSGTILWGGAVRRETIKCTVGYLLEKSADVATSLTRRLTSRRALSNGFLRRSRWFVTQVVAAHAQFQFLLPQSNSNGIIALQVVRLPWTRSTAAWNCHKIVQNISHMRYTPGRLIPVSAPSWQSPLAPSSGWGVTCLELQ